MDIVLSINVDRILFSFAKPISLNLEDVLKVVFSSLNHQILHQTKPPPAPKFGGWGGHKSNNLYESNILLDCLKIPYIVMCVHTKFRFAEQQSYL